MRILSGNLVIMIRNVPPIKSLWHHYDSQISSSFLSVSHQKPLEKWFLAKEQIRDSGLDFTKFPRVFIPIITRRRWEYTDLHIITKNTHFFHIKSTTHKFKQIEYETTIVNVKSMEETWEESKPNSQYQSPEYWKMQIEDWNQETLVSTLRFSRR